MTPFRGKALLALAALGIPAIWILVSAGKPFHVDDTLFLTWAREIAPLAGETRTEEINWRGFREPLIDQTRHYPPGWALTLALARRACGDVGSALHWLQWPFAAMFLWGCVLLARRFGVPAWPVLMISTTSPLFLLPAASLMPDVACLGPGVLGLALWMSSRSLSGFIRAGLLLVLSAQMKQTVLPLLPLMFLDPVCRLQKDPKRLVVAALTVLLCGVYPRVGADSGTDTIASHVIWILGWAWEPRLLVPKLAYAGAVLSAVAVFPVAFGILAVSKAPGARDFARLKAFALGFVSLVILSALGFWKGKALAGVSSVPPVLAGATALWFDVCLICFLAWAVLAMRGLVRENSRWLLVWVFLVIAGNVLGTPFPAARFFVFILPPLTVLLLLDAGARVGSRIGAAVTVAAIAGNLWLSAGLAYSDSAFARFSREAAERGARLAAIHGVPLRTTGHWGIQFYVEVSGGAVLDRARDRLGGGALVLEPEIADGKPFPKRLVRRGESRQVWTAPAPFVPAVFAPARTLPPKVHSASFHGGHVWFPYGFSLAPFEEITVIRVAPSPGR